MLLTFFLAICFCAAMTLMLISAVTMIRNDKFLSSAPKEALELLKPRTGEIFYGAKTMGWVLMAISIIMILGIGVVSIWDGFRCDFSFWQFFIRFVLIFTTYKVYDMIFFDWFLLCKFQFFSFTTRRWHPYITAGSTDTISKASFLSSWSYSRRHRPLQPGSVPSYKDRIN